MDFTECCNACVNAIIYYAFLIHCDAPCTKQKKLSIDVLVASMGRTEQNTGERIRRDATFYV